MHGCKPVQHQKYLVTATQACRQAEHRQEGVPVVHHDVRGVAAVGGLALLVLAVVREHALGAVAAAAVTCVSLDHGEHLAAVSSSKPLTAQAHTTTDGSQALDIEAGRTCRP